MAKTTLLIAIAFAVAVGLAAYRDSPVGPQQARAANFSPANVSALITAINTANSNGQDDVIDLGGNTFTLTSVDNNDSGANGLPSIAADGGSSLTIQNGTIERDGAAPNFRILHVAANAELILSGVTISGGVSTSGGGGIYNDGSLTLDNATVSLNVASSSAGGGIFTTSGTDLLIEAGSIIGGNNASNGGGIYSNAGSVTLDASSVGENSTGDGSCTEAGQTLGGGGGGIENDLGLLIIRNGSSVSGNGVFGNGAGGGIYNYFGTATITDSVVNGNCTRSGRGGGIYNFDGDVSLTRTTVDSNEADNNGGGIFTTAVVDSSLTIYESTVSNNTTGFRGFNGNGGGIFNDGDDVHITDSTITVNHAPNAGGGGIYNGLDFNDTYGTVDLINATVSANSSLSDSGSGVHNDGAATDVTMVNTIVAQNTPDDCSGTGVTSDGHNLDSDGSCALGGTGDISSGNADLGSLSNNGGATFTRALGPNSDAIDAGDNAICSVAYDPETENGKSGLFDQRGTGFDRISPSGGVCDIGAYEVQANTATVQVIKDFTDNSTNTVNVSLTCPSADSVTPNGSQTLGDGDEVDYDVSFSGASVSCTIAESAIVGYSESVQCEENNQVTGEAGGASYVIDELGPDDVYTCTFTNSPLASNTATVEVIKNFTNNTRDTVRVSLTCPSANSVTPNGSETLGDSGSVEYQVLFSGDSVNCTVSEPNSAAYNESVQCDEGNQMVGSTPSGTSYMFELDPGDVYVCTFTNRPVTAPSPTPTKTPTPTPSPTPTQPPILGTPQEVLICTASSTTPQTGSQVTITCTAKDGFGMPEASIFVTFAISSQPGNDAAVGSLVTKKSTDTNGVAVATLKVGSTPGMIVLDNTIANAQSRVVVNVQGAAAAATPQVAAGASAASAPVVAPAGTSAITPPNTGDAGLAAGSNGHGRAWPVVLGVAVLSIGLSFALRRQLQRR